MYVLDTDQNSVSQGASLAKVENAEVPAGAGDIYYIYIDHWTDYNSVPSSYVITSTPGFAVSDEKRSQMSASNADFSMEKILIAKRPDFNEITIPEDGTQNVLIEEMGEKQGGLVDVTPAELFAMANMPEEMNIEDDLEEKLIKVLEKGRWSKALAILQSRAPGLFVEPHWNHKLHVESFRKDPSYNTYQWWNFDVVNLPEGLDRIGAEVKPVNVAVLDSGSPYSVDPAYQRSIFNTEWGWDMEDNDNLADDVEFEQQSFSHGVHVGSTISQLNDGIDGNGFGARVTPLRVCYQSGCGPTYEAYLFLNGDDNQSETSFAQRSGNQPLHAMNMSYGGGGSDGSASCSKLAQLSEKGVLVASSSGNGGIGSMNYPSACPTVFSVAATNGTHRRSSYSSTNPRVDFAAPGGEYSDWGSEGSSNPDGVDDLVYAYAYQDFWVNDSNNGNYMIGAQGTSMASPHGAGFLGLIKYYWEEVVKPFESNPNLPSILGYREVESMLAANLLTNDVNKESREFDTTARPGWDEHLGYGIIDLDKALKSIDAFETGYFTDIDDLPYYDGPSQVNLNSENGYQGSFTITPYGPAGDGFNEVTYTYVDEFLDLEVNGLNFNVSKAADYNWAGWVNTNITFDFPLVEGATLPFDGYELLSVGVTISFHVLGEATEANFPALRAKLIDSDGIVVQERTSAVVDGQGYFVFDELSSGTYRMTLGSDINGDNSWGGPGEMSGASGTFEITDSSVNDISVMLAPEVEGTANAAPVITSAPITQAYVNNGYFYVVAASDDDGDSLSYAVEIINRDTGAEANFLSFLNNFLQGTPRDDDIGEYDVRIIVSDGTDAAVQEFILAVEE